MDVRMGGWRGRGRVLSLGLILLSHLLLLVPPCCRGQDVEGAPQSGSLFTFTEAAYHATVYENSAARTYLKTQVKMGISLTQKSWEIRFRVTSGDEEGLFKAEEHVVGDFCFLRIRTKGGNAAILNREIQDSYALTVKASVKGDALLETWAKVHIQVLDMNDLRPLFSPTTYSVTIAEDTPLRASIAQVTATDADIGPNGEFYYFFKDRVELFAVHPTSGVVFLSGRLNADEQKRYDLEILAVDRGTKLYGNNGVSSTAKLFVRVERANKHAPLMDVVTHDPPRDDKDPVYAVVTVEDVDEGLNGEIDSVVMVDPSGVFSVNRSDGNEFTVTAVKSIDWDLHPDGFNLTLQAKDRGNPQRVSNTLVVHVAEKVSERTAAKFDRESYEVYLNEFSPPGTIVLALEMKPEPRNPDYRFEPSADSLFFQIHSLRGVISTAKWLTQQAQNIFKLEVTEISSELRVKVCVIIQDANDNTPSFSQSLYVVSVSESVPVGTSVLTVSALDRDQGENGYITYSVSSPQPLPFAINQFSGIVSTTQELDFELSESFEFVVRASDWGSPYRRESEANVTIRLENVNDNHPVFEKLACHGTVSRDLPVHQVITTMSAVDVDDLALVKYKIVSGNELEFFDLDADSGALVLQRSLATAGPMSNTFSLKITATDGENLSDPVFVNISVAQGKQSQGISCTETRIAQKLAEKLMKKSRFTTKPKVEEDFIDIFSVNRQTPQFAAGFATDVAVREDLKVGSSVYQVSAYDGDAGFNGQIVYSISGGNTDSCFTIAMDTGLMTVFMPLDRERRDRYVLNITIYDLGLPSKSAWHLLSVHVQDANDNGPLFLQSGDYTVAIPENTPIGQEVIQVGATDQDLGANGDIVYSVLTRTSHFAINSTNGVVYVAGQLDRELVSAFSLKIEARDQAEPGQQKFTTTTLKIVLTDVNDCPPRFIPSVYRARAREDLPVGTVVAWLETQDPDLGLGGQVRFSLASDYSGWFEIDKTSGVIRLMRELDYESQQFYNLTVKAKDKGKPVSLLSVTFVEIEVVDVNENLQAPYFTNFALTGSVKENSSVGTTVIQVSATDEDSGKDGEIQYSIHDGTGLGLFAIDEATGMIYTTDLLDRETKDSYWLTVYATDGGVVPQLATLEVFVKVEDVNDNAPLTSEPLYWSSVQENSVPDMSVVQIQAQDPDGPVDPTSADQLSYRIVGGNEHNFFSINSRTGLISTTSRSLDREQQTEHVLEVLVSDGGESPRHSTAWVMVQVLDQNDNQPVFLQQIYRVQVPERERRRKGDAVFRVSAFDPDEGSNARLSYSIVDGNQEGRFSIDARTGVVFSRKASAAGNYDILTIKATDAGSPPKFSTARLHLESVRQAPPSTPPLAFQEPSYHFTVPETSAVAQVVGVVSLTRSSAGLWFDFSAPRSSREVFYVLPGPCIRNCSLEVGVNSDVGTAAAATVGTIVTTRGLDAEQFSWYNLTLQASDGSNTAYTQVYITVVDHNDNPPIFSQPTYEATVSEDLQPDTEVVQVVASDLDRNHRLTFSLQSSIDPSSLNLFRIHPSLGTIFTSRPLDRESCAQHVLTVMVRDQEVPFRMNLARVLIEVEDKNDHVPLFTSATYTGTVYESAAVGSAVVRVTAVDKDKGRNAQLHYSIDSGNNGDTFHIEPHTGFITVAHDLDLSRSSQYLLTVRATDGGSPPLSSTASVHVSVTVPDNAAPRFSMPVYHAEVTEYAVAGTSVVAVSAVSKSTLTYEFKRGNAGSAFRMNQYSGVISTRHPLDFESVASYALTVQAVNMAGVASNATVLIQVKDENDNSPVFKQRLYRGSISEAAAVGSVVLNAEGSALVIKATDADSNLNGLLLYEIVEEEARRFFSIESQTGLIRTVANLDHETHEIFHFYVHVKDSGRPQLTADTPAEVTIQVIDTNDSPPSFTQSAYEAVLLFPTYEGVEALQVSATDPDRNVSTNLTYSFTDGALEDFAIDPSSGVIIVKRSNFSKQHFHFTVKVSDGKFSGAALVSIFMKQALDSGLRFIQSIYSSTIRENLSNVTTVAVVSAVGNRLNEPLKYSLLNGRDYFQIRPTSGVIQTTGVPFDREEKEFYELVVEARRELDHLHVARVLVSVQVDDVNDNVPVFVGLPYYAAVQVDAKPGSLICRVMAVDEDKGLNGEVSYFLKNDFGHFEVHQRTGSLTLKRAFESDLCNVDFHIVVFASDGGDPPLSSTAEFPISVVNKAMPAFDKSFYSSVVSEDASVHTPVLGINASSPRGQNIFYTIVDGDPSVQFDVGFNTGVLSVIHPLDYETASSYHLTVRATDSLTGAHAEVSVDLQVQDVNDNPPIFQERLYRAVLSESSTVGTPALQVVATDRDSVRNNVIHYRILSNGRDSTDYFHIDSSSGLILTARTLDHELVQKFVFIVRATDNGFPALSSEVLVTVTVNDVNDNPPVFNQLIYEAYVNEMAPRGHFVTCVQASDADSSDFDKLEYSILSGNERMLFVMDQKTGVVTLSSRHKQRMEPFYSLYVSVSDGIFSSTAQVLVTVWCANLYSPVFEQNMYVAQLKENSPVGTKIVEVKAIDPDPGQDGHIVYSVVNNVDKFAIDSSGRITTLEKLDREDRGNENVVVKVEAKDSGGLASSCSVLVTLLDENDNAPTFCASEYKTSVKSDAPPGLLVIQVQAIDPDDGANAKITYLFHSEGHFPLADVLDLHPDSGWIVTKGSLGHLKNSVLSFFVKAVDSGNPSHSSLVSVYVNVLCPECSVPVFGQSKYYFYTPEDSHIGSVVGKVQVNAADGLDMSTATFSLVNGKKRKNNQDEVFVVEPYTGLIRLEKPLDHESIKRYHFKVTATLQQATLDLVISADIQVQVLDINDNKPTFEANSYEATVMEGMPVGSRIMKVEAVDPDSDSNGQVTYSLGALMYLEENSDSLVSSFTIDSDSGWISTRRDLDHEENPSYVFTVVASDRGENLLLSSSTTVTIVVEDVNDNPPRFLEQHYRATVKESDSPGEVVAMVNTRDDDSSANHRQVSYHITGGNQRGVFDLGLVQDEWKMYVKQPLDREQSDSYVINVTASDGLFVCETTVAVTVTDANDNQPLFLQPVYTESVPEDIPVHTVLLRVRATDQDTGTNSLIKYSLHGVGSQDFSVDQDTGEIKSTVNLDRELVPSYRFFAQATDGGGRWCRAEVKLTITDVNDNPPVFTLSQYTASVYEDTAPKALLTRIQAIDPDEGPGRVVVYSLADSAGDTFSVDKSSGILILEQSLDREVQSTYQLTVRAFDLGSPRPLSSSVNVTVLVLDINDNPPVFEHRDQLATVPEDVRVGTEVLSVHAASKDIGTNAEITYAIRSGNEHRKFHIHPLTGVISVLKPLDFETGRDYFLTVEAWDGGTPPLSAVTTININLTDVNDNPPVFSSDLYTAAVSEDAAADTFIVKVVAEDADSRLNGAVLYSIIGGDQGEQFVIDPVSGLVKVNKPLDRETIPKYSLTILATDGGIPSMSSTTMVDIDVLDINDNPPTFSLTSLTTVTQENKPVGTSILKLAVTDEDSAQNGPPYQFTILSGNDGQEFVLEKDGTLVANKVLRRDRATEHVLQIQVTDSGKPRLSSVSSLSVRVIEESLHPPVVSPLEIHIVTMEDEFPGGIIGQLYASDADPHDALTFGHTLPAQRSLFKIGPRDGRIVALGGLDAGSYSLNASVSDGHFTVPVTVDIHVKQATPRMLHEAVTVRFESVTPQDFVSSHLSAISKVLRTTAASPADTVHLLGLQPVGGTRQLDLLVAVGTTGVEGYYKAAYLTQKLSASRRHLEELLRVSAILDKNCSGLECRGAQCVENIVLEPLNLATYSTARVSFVSPRFHRTSRCICYDGSCATLAEQCQDQPCPADMQCFTPEPTTDSYGCRCPSGKLGECAGHSSLSFSGNSYIKYRLFDWLQPELKVSLRIRTLQSRGLILFTQTEPCVMLQLRDGKLFFQLSCVHGDADAMASDLTGVSGHHINDGHWHTVALELNHNFSGLAVDNSYFEQRLGPSSLPSLTPDKTICLGALVQTEQSPSGQQKNPLVLQGFQGCLDSVLVNANQLPLQNKRSHVAEVVELAEIKLGCVLHPDHCRGQRCLNGATCVNLPSGGFSCRCSPRFTGRHCELEITACVPNPCNNGGACRTVGAAFLCSCRRGFKGLTCEEDVNECARSNLADKCENGGLCVNTHGSFYCNCTAGFVGQRCGSRPVVVPDMRAGHAAVGREELAGISVMLLIIVALVVSFVVLRKRFFQKEYSRTDLSLVQDPATAALLNKAAGFHFKTLHCHSREAVNLFAETGLGSTVAGGSVFKGPPQVPVRPVAYTPCFKGDPTATLQKAAESRGGAEHTELRTFHPGESPRILPGGGRKGVVVCSVAPNLPPVSPSCSEDSICKSPWDSKEGLFTEDDVDMDKVTSFSRGDGDGRNSDSEVKGGSLLRSDSCEDNTSIVTVIRLVNDVVDTIESEVSDMENRTFNKAYHWHTLDWRPNAKFLDTEDVPTGQVVPGNPVAVTPGGLEGRTPLLESDYYLGGYDVDSDRPTSHAEVVPTEDLPVLPSDQVSSESWTPIASALRLGHQDVLDFGSTASHLGPNFLPRQSCPSPPLRSGHTRPGEFRSSVREDDLPGDASPQSLGPENVARVSHSERSLSLDGTAHFGGGETASCDSQLQTEV